MESHHLSDEKKLYAIYETFDDLMVAGEFDTVAKTLNDVVFTDDMSIPIMIGYLTASFMGRDKIHSWKFYRKRVHAMLLLRGKSVAEADNILQGLE
jgi:hypothetical protein